MPAPAEAAMTDASRRTAEDLVVELRPIRTQYATCVNCFFFCGGVGC